MCGCANVRILNEQMFWRLVFKQARCLFCKFLNSENSALILKILIIFAGNKHNISTMNHTEEANQEKHYLLIVVAVIIGIVGIYLRFADFQYNNIVANCILIVGAALALKAVFAILK